MSDATPAGAPGPIIRKVLNNNVVVVAGPDGTERVLMGRGLGFQRRAGEDVDPALVDKVFVLDQGADRAHIQELLASVPLPIVDAVLAAVGQAEEDLGRDLGRHLPIAVIDHIQFVLERLDEGIRIPAAAGPELVALYPDEYATAQRMSAAIGAHLGRELPEEEAVFLTMHVLAATSDEENGNAALLIRRVQHVVSTVEASLGRELDKTTLDYSRFVVHVRFLLQRLVSERMLQAADTSFFQFARNNYPRSYGVATRVREWVLAATGSLLTDEEMLYLIVHVERLSRATAEQPDAPTRV